MNHVALQTEHLTRTFGAVQAVDDLSLPCADDTEWTFVGEQTLRGKEAVRQWMATNYTEQTTFSVASMIAEGDFVVALGTILTKNEDGQVTPSAYCDVWRFRQGMIAELQAFVIQSEVKDETGGAV